MHHGDDPYQLLISYREVIWGGLKHVMMTLEGQCFLVIQLLPTVCTRGMNPKVKQQVKA